MTRFSEHEAAGRSLVRYRVWLPSRYEERAEPWPLIMFLHGRDESGLDNIGQTTVGLGPSLVRHPDRWPFAAVFPQKPERDVPWDTHRDALLTIVDETSRTYRVDPARRYLTGVSQGGHETWELGAAQPELWAALVPVCGYGPPADYARTLARMPVWAFHGQADPIVPHECSAAIVRALEGAGGSVRFTSYPGVGHDAWEQAYAEPELPSWLLGHARRPESP